MKRPHSPRLSGSGEPCKLGVPQTQRERFIETARALGCDEDEAAFDEKLKVIARHKPKDKLKLETESPQD